MITSERPDFSYQGYLLEHIEQDPRYRIKHISVKSMSGGAKHPHIEVVEAEENKVNTSELFG